VIFTYAVPRDDALSRFVALLMDHQSLILKMFHKLVDAFGHKLALPVGAR
jgi:hypothetical protein